jgi:hypothetical protein
MSTEPPPAEPAPADPDGRWDRALDEFEARLSGWAALADGVPAPADLTDDISFADLGPPPPGVRGRAHALLERSLSLGTSLVVARDAVGQDLARGHRPAHVYDGDQSSHILDRRG